MYLLPTFIMRFYMHSFVLECSHRKAAVLYADAVMNGTKYLATKCIDCFLFLLDDDYCKENDKIYIGPHVDMKT